MNIETIINENVKNSILDFSVNGIRYIRRLSILDEYVSVLDAYDGSDYIYTLPIINDCVCFEKKYIAGAK